MKRTVVDASSAILMFKARMFVDLMGAYQVVLAESVYQEVSRPGYPGASSFGGYYGTRRFRVSRVNHSSYISPEQAAALSVLGSGEKDTIRLFLNGGLDFVIIDDGKGAGFCREYQIPYVNSLLVARILYLFKRVSETVFQDKVETLIRLGRYSQKIIDYALTCPSKELSLFMPG